MSAADRSAGPGPPARVRILHLEDDARDAELVSALLAEAGIEAEIARVDSRADYAAALERGGHDLILADYTIPGFDGLSALDLAHARRPDTPFVFVSGTLGEEAAIECLVRGADDYVLKQNMKRLASAVRHHLREAAERARARRAEEALRESAFRLQSLIDNSPSVIYAKDRDGRHVLVNRRFLDLFNTRQEDVLGKANHDLVPPGEAASYRANDEAVWTSGKPIDFEEQVRQADGIHTYFSQKFLLRDRAGQPYALCGISTDVTRSKLLEEQLRQAQKLEAIGQLAGGIAHDFNNMLMVMGTNLEMLMEHVAGNERLSGLVATAISATLRGADLNRRIVAFARRQPLQPAEVDVNRLVTGMTELLRRTLGAQVEIETVLAGGLWKCVADPGQIENALLNLAVNARDAMPGGGRLTIETSNARLDDTYAAAHAEVTAGQYVMIAVSDTGAGMSPEVQRRAFEPFFTTKEIGHGTGLGLSMVFGFVKQSGGHVKIYSEPGHGTTLKIYLPRDTGSARAPQQAAVPDYGVPRGDETILAVEDEPTVLANLKTSLESLGYRVLAAEDGPHALAELAKCDRLDLLFTDVILPGGMNGRQVAEEVLRRFPQAKVLYSSGYTDNAIVHQGRLDDGAQLLVKPYLRADLARKVRAVLDVGKPGGPVPRPNPPQGRT